MDSLITYITQTPRFFHLSNNYAYMYYVVTVSTHFTPHLVKLENPLCFCKFLQHERQFAETAASLPWANGIGIELSPSISCQNVLHIVITRVCCDTCYCTLKACLTSAQGTWLWPNCCPHHSNSSFLLLKTQWGCITVVAGIISLNIFVCISWRSYHPRAAVFPSTFQALPIMTSPTLIAKQLSF